MLFQLKFYWALSDSIDLLWGFLKHILTLLNTLYVLHKKIYNMEG
jgi:hypothetical protein